MVNKIPIWLFTLYVATLKDGRPISRSTICTNDEFDEAYQTKEFVSVQGFINNLRKPHEK